MFASIITNSLSWAKAHPETAAAIVLWIVANVVPRPHPEEMTGWKKSLWYLIDRLSVFTAKGLPGDLKPLFAPSPSPEPKAVEEKKEEDITDSLPDSKESPEEEKKS